MYAHPNIIAARPVPIGDVQIVEWCWPSPLDIVAREGRHMIELSIPPHSVDAVGSFPDLAPGHRTRMGRMFVRPAGVAIRSRSAGGRIRVSRLAVEPTAFENLAGEPIVWNATTLSAGLDMRDPTVLWLMERLRAELESPGFGHAVLVDAYATSLAIETARLLKGVSANGRETGRLAHWQERRVCERLAVEGPPPSVAELAQLCGISARHFARLYGGETGIGASARIAEMQVGRARSLLRTSDLPMKEIAARLGFARAGSFSSAFRRATGQTPSAYRQEHRKSGEGYNGRKVGL